MTLGGNIDVEAQYECVSNLVIFFRDEEIVKCFIDRLVVVILYRSQVRLNQRQLFNLRAEKINNSILASDHKAHSECMIFTSVIMSTC